MKGIVKIAHNLLKTKNIFFYIALCTVTLELFYLGKQPLRIFCLITLMKMKFNFLVNILWKDASHFLSDAWLTRQNYLYVTQ